MPHAFSPGSCTWELGRAALLFCPEPVLPVIWSAWLSRAQQQVLFTSLSVPGLTILTPTLILILAVVFTITSCSPQGSSKDSSMCRQCFHKMVTFRLGCSLVECLPSIMDDLSSILSTTKQNETKIPDLVLVY